jgi:hypothetical protein
VPRDTGFPRADVENDFLRVRRRQVLSRLSSWLSREPDDVNLMLPFDEVVAALGNEGERRIGLKTIKLGAIVGTVDSRHDFDRRFRPTSARVRERWEQLALAQRRGTTMPPIDVYKLGDMYFIRDGHHRVSIAMASGQTTIDAYVTEVRTTIAARDIRTRRDILFKSYERMFVSRAPLPAPMRAKISVTEPWSYAELGECVEAWGFRFSQHEHRFCDREEIARRWFTEEYTPVVRMLRDADLLGDGTDADAYLRVAADRYRLILTHDWSDDVIQRLRGLSSGRRRKP